MTSILKFFNRYPIVIDVISIIVISIIAWTIIYSCAIIGFDQHHDGFMFKTALDLSHGKIMYRDTYSQYGIINAYIHAIFILLLGEKVLSIRIATVFMYIIIFVMNYIIWKRFIRRRLSFLTSLILIFLGPYMMTSFAPWSSVSALLFLTISSYFYILYIDHDKNILLYFSITFMYISFLCRQPVGIMLFAAFLFINFLLYKLQGNNKYLYDIYKFLGVITVLSCIFVTYLIISNSYNDYYTQNISFMMKFAKENGNISKNYFQIDIFLQNLIAKLLGRQTKEFIWALLPIITLCHFITIIICLKCKTISKRNYMILILTIFSIASWHQYFPITDISHCYWGAVPMFGVVCHCIYLYFRLKKISNKSILKISASILTIFIFTLIFSQSLSKRIVSYAATQELNFTKFHDNNFQYLNNLKLSKNNCEYYLNFHAALKSAITNYKKNVINQTQDGYFAIFSNYNYHPQFNNWPPDQVYEDYNLITSQYILRQHPIIIAYTGSIFNNYHVYLPEDINNGKYYHGLEATLPDFMPSRPVCIYVPGFVNGNISHIQIGTETKNLVKENKKYVINDIHFEISLLHNNKSLIITTNNKQFSEISIYLKPQDDSKSIIEYIRTCMRYLLNADLLPKIADSNDIGFLYQRIDNIKSGEKTSIPFIYNISDIIYIGFKINNDYKFFKL